MVRIVMCSLGGVGERDVPDMCEAKKRWSYCRRFSIPLIICNLV